MSIFQDLSDMLEAAADGPDVERLTKLAAEVLQGNPIDDLLEDTEDLADLLGYTFFSEHARGGASLFQEAKMQNEVYSANLRQLAFETASGQLITREEVTAAVFNFARAACDAIMNIPDRVGAETAAEVVSYLAPLLTREVGEKKARAIVEGISLPELTRVMYRLWEREARYVLEHLGRGTEAPEAAH